MFCDISGIYSTQRITVL